MATVKDLIERLQTTYNPDDVLAVAIWCLEDVKGRAKQLKINITDEKAKDVLDRIDRKQSAELGISWDTIDAYLSDIEDEPIDVPCKRCGRTDLPLHFNRLCAECYPEEDK